MNKSLDHLATTLVYLQKNGRTLLGKKVRGHGVGKWNGAGGKCNNNERPEDCARRKVREELGVNAMNLTPVAVLTFTQRPVVDEYSNLTTYVYICDEWQNDLTASEELSQLTWFTGDDIPYGQMWDDDRHWLPQVLAGETVHGTFTFDAQDRLITHDVTIDAVEQPTLGINERVEEIIGDQ